MSCPYCGKPHFPDKCRIVTDPTRRKVILVDKKRCFICTRGGHTSQKCKAKRMCYKCNGKHHTSLCTEPRNNDGNNDEEENVEENNGNQTLVAKTEEGSKEVEVTETPKENTVLLQTAFVTILNPSTGERVNCRIILDVCSQRTYISVKIQRKLKVKSAGNDLSSTGTFGGGSTGVKNRDVVVVGVQKGNSETLFIKAVVVDKICSPIHGQAVDVAKDHYRHLYGLKLADEPASGPVDVEMLIGGEFYWRIMSGRSIR